VNGDPAPAPATGAPDGHLHRTGRRRTQPEHGRRRTVAQERTVATCQHRSHVAGVRQQERMTDGVDARVNRVEAPSSQAVPDSVAAEPNLQQLPAAHDPVLASRQPRHPHVRCDISIGSGAKDLSHRPRLTWKV